MTKRQFVVQPISHAKFKTLNWKRILAPVELSIHDGSSWLGLHNWTSEGTRGFHAMRHRKWKSSIMAVQLEGYYVAEEVWDLALKAIGLPLEYKSSRKKVERSLGKPLPTSEVGRGESFLRYDVQGEKSDSYYLELVLIDDRLKHLYIMLPAVAARMKA